MHEIFIFPSTVDEARSVFCMINTYHTVLLITEAWKTAAAYRVNGVKSGILRTDKLFHFTYCHVIYLNFHANDAKNKLTFLWMMQDTDNNRIHQSEVL